ncbi:MAG TPA: TonB-dependent receptor plug domain-containing protein [Rhodothermales bacterium]|nr:TonB-dependent receptor plug domain-containing protein [Rhodothermales bacterium]
MKVPAMLHFLVGYLGTSARRFWLAAFVFLVLGLPGLANGALAQAQDTLPPLGQLKTMSIEELMNIEVTSVSKRPEKLSEAASAIQVITQEEIHRSGATNLAEALQLAPNLQVAQLNSYAWIISTRGFNALFSNKLLAMIDGRTIYTPLFAGVSWDVQNVLLDDIDRIEVVSGPGGSLWGANAVNGVINVVTKHSADTQGLYASAAVGSFLQDQAAVRYGGHVGEKLSYRIFAQRFDRNNTVVPGGEDNSDDWHLTQGGFRMDWLPSGADAVMLEGNLYGGSEETSPRPSAMNGGYVLGSWSRTFSPASAMQVQLYVDHTWRRDVPSTLTDELTTYDLDFQHRFPVGGRNNILWGAGYRLMDSDVRNSTEFVGFVPMSRTMHLFSGFVQDEIALVQDQLKLTVGTKLEHNVFSGFEVQPSTRLAWTPDGRQTIWSAVSRAIRAPSRIDVDYHIPAHPVEPGTPNVNGGPNFGSENVVAYEAGYRVQPTSLLALSLAVFYNRYDDLYSVEALPGTMTYEIQNGSEGETWGAELSGSYQPARWWRLHGGYVYLGKDLRSKPGHAFDTSILGNDPQHQFLLQSMMDLPGNFQFDVVSHYGGVRPVPHIPGYFTLDARLAWQFKGLELSVVGRNLTKKRHLEYGALIPRNVYGKVTWRL